MSTRSGYLPTQIRTGAILDYALGTIDSKGAREVEGLLAERPEVAAGLRSMQDGLAEMVLSLPPLPLHEELEERIVARVEGVEQLTARAGSSRGRRRTGGGPLWAALALAATLGLTAWLIFQRFGPLRERPLERAPEVVMDREGERAGVLVRLTDESLFLAFDEAPPEGGAYRIWLVEGGEDGDVRLLAVSDGRAVHITNLPEDARVHVTRSPGGGEPGPAATGEQGVGAMEATGSAEEAATEPWLELRP